jgi:2-polyprenyl-3-methyl-5-hydroxy-6-metoxy-1,4-benzoquinol methylase
VRENGLCVVEGDVIDLPVEAILPREGMRFDAVCIWNTFDQVNRPSALLPRLRTLLAPGGLLALRVPNGAFETACSLISIFVLDVPLCPELLRIRKGIRGDASLTW